MINFLAAIALLLVVAILIVYLIDNWIRPMFIYHDDLIDSTTTTTTVTSVSTEHSQNKSVKDWVNTLPDLKRQFKENGQPFVTDPVDGTDWMLNTNDDIYQDANDRWWRLV